MCASTEATELPADEVATIGPEDAVLGQRRWMAGACASWASASRRRGRDHDPRPRRRGRDRGWPVRGAKEQIAGFDILDCADLDEAIEVAAKHPVARFGTLELRPFVEE